jgi:hypothetical protein
MRIRAVRFASLTVLASYPGSFTEFADDFATREAKKKPLHERLKVRFRGKP